MNLAKKRKVTRTKKKSSNNSSMIIFSIVGLLVLVVVATALFLNFSSNNADDDKTLPMEEEGEVVALVNGEPITKEELDKEFAALPQQLQLSMDDPAVLQQLMDKRLLVQKAKEADIDIQKDIDAILEENDITLETLQATVTTEQVTWDDFVDQLRIWAYLNQTLFERLQVTDEELQTFYEENEELFVSPESVTARHILISTENRSLEEAQELMDEVESELTDDNFCELVTEYSEDPGSLETCGQYGPFTKDSNFVQAFKDAAFENEVGEYQVVETSFGLHLIETVQKTEEGTLDIEQVEEQLRSTLLYEKQKSLYADYIEELREEADIVICSQNPEACEMTQEQTEQQNNQEVELNGVEDENEKEETSVEELAECLSDKGAKMYGAYWCSHCAAQKEAFGDAWDKIDYVECATDDGQAPECAEAGIQGYPTWVINGEQFPGKQSFVKLAQEAGCEF